MLQKNNRHEVSSLRETGSTKQQVDQSLVDIKINYFVLQRRQVFNTNYSQFYRVQTQLHIHHYRKYQILLLNRNTTYR